MRSVVILIAGIFSFFYIDLRYFKRRIVGFSTNESISIELSEQREKLRKKLKKYKNKKFKKKRIYQQKQYKLKGSHPKDKRYSNQKLLRRMYRNG